MKVKLGEVCSIAASRTPLQDDTVWLLNLDMVEQQTGRVIDYVYLDRNALGASTVAFDEDAVLYSKLRPNLNKVVLPDRKGYATSEMLPLKPNADLSREYLAWFLRSPSFVEYAVGKVTGAKMPRLGAGVLLETRLELPALEEQRHIADVFFGISDIIDKRKQQLQKLDELIKARFVEMFGDINTNNKGWNMQPLGELCTIVRGGSPRPIEQFLGGDVPWIKIGDATEDDSIYLNSTKEHIIQEGVKRSRLVKKGSLIFANCGVSLGFARIITFDGCIHDGWLAMEDIDDRLNKVFLLQALNQMTEHFRAIAPAGTQPNLNTAIMKAYLQIIPPMELQEEYIAFVSQVGKSKLSIKASLDQIETLKQSLIQQYFG